MRKHLVLRIKKLTSTKTPTSDDYKELVTAVLARIIIFNAKRGGEAGKMLLENYHNPLPCDNREEFSLTSLETKLSSRSVTKAYFIL